MKNSTRRVVADVLPMAGVIFGMLIATALSIASISRIGEFQQNVGWVEHTYQVRFDLEQAALLASDAQAGVRGFLITGRPEFLAPFEAARSTLPRAIKTLAVLVADNPPQHRRLDVLSVSVDRFMSLMQEALELKASHPDAASAFAFVTEGSGDRALYQIRVQIKEFQAVEAALLTEREKTLIHGSRDTRLMLIGGTATIFLLVGGAFWSLLREIRQRKRTDQALTVANTNLVRNAEVMELTNKELESFSYSVSHDLRIPLRAVSGYSNILAEDYDGVLDDEGKRLINVIQTNSKKMGMLIDDLLAFSKLGRQTLNATEIDMPALLKEVITEVRGRDRYEHAVVVLGDVPMGWGDRTLIRQVWINLISNALKYSSKNTKAEIHISGSRNDVEFSYSIRDNGAGFDMAYYNKLFGVFQRLHSENEFPGTGVGLAIVQRIIVRHGGRLWAESIVDQGATFNFTLPRREMI